MDTLNPPASALRVFLCHSSDDKPVVRDLYQRLRSAADYIVPWLDEEDLLPGQRWQDEIPKAIRNSDVVIVCLSRNSMNKKGYVQKEIKFALDVADEQPEGTIYLIPVGLEDCEIPERLKHLHCVNLGEGRGFEQLLRSLQSRAEKLGIPQASSSIKSDLPNERTEQPRKTSSNKDFLSLLKRSGAKAIGIVGLVTSLIAFISLAAGNKGIVTIATLCIGLGVTEIVLLYIFLKKREVENNLIVSTESSSSYGKRWRYSKGIRWLALSLAVAVPVIVVVMAVAWKRVLDHPSPKFVVLVTHFDGPDENKYRTTDILVERLREATEKYPEVEIRALSRTVTVQQGPAEARKIGEENKASIVLWGWYGLTNSEALTKVHFEILANPKELELERNNQTLKVPLDDIERFEMQINLSNEMSYLTLLIMGLSRYEIKDYAGAIERFTDALKLPANPTVISPAVIYSYRGNAFSIQNDLDKAIADYTQAVTLQADNAEVYHNRGIAYGEKRDYGSAIGDFTRVLELDPDYVIDYYNRGYAYDLKGDDKSAIADYSRAINLKPDYADAYNNRGIAYDEIGEYDLAIADLSKYISFQPDNAYAYYNRGLVYGRKGEYDLAIADFTQAISLQPDYSDAYHMRGFAHSSKKEHDLAIADYSRAIILKPDLADAYYKRGDAYASKGEYDLAVADFSKFISIEPNTIYAYVSRGKVYELKGERGLADADFKKAKELKRTSSR
jgi:tetratricopeptide (TPR) repeat protein